MGWYLIIDGPAGSCFMNFRQDVECSWPRIVRRAEVIILVVIYDIFFRESNHFFLFQLHIVVD